MPKKTKKIIAYHFTNDKLRDGRPIPPIGEWLEETGELRLCVKGLHASRTPFQALAHAPGLNLHRVEIEDIAAESDDKLVARRRRILATIDAKDLILEFARKQALSMIHLYDCPPVLKKWLETGDPALQKTAANAANSAANAASAAYYAASAANANSAANAASDTYYAASAAYYAASAANAYYDATDAANSAANAASAAYYAASAANAYYAVDTRKKAAATFNKAIQRAFREAK